MNYTQAHPELNKRQLWHKSGGFPLPLGVRQKLRERQRAEERNSSTYNLSKLKCRQECEACSSE